MKSSITDLTKRASHLSHAARSVQIWGYVDRAYDLAARGDEAGSRRAIRQMMTEWLRSDPRTRPDLWDVLLALPPAFRNAVVERLNQLYDHLSTQQNAEAQLLAGYGISASDFDDADGDGDADE